MNTFYPWMPPDQKISRSPAGTAELSRARCWLVQPHLAHLGFFLARAQCIQGFSPQQTSGPAFLANSQILHPPTRNRSQQEYCEVVRGGRRCASGPGTGDKEGHSGCGRGDGGGCVLARVSCKASWSRYGCEPARCLQRSCADPSVSRLPLDGEPTADPGITAALLGGRDGAGGMSCWISNRSQIPARVQEVRELRTVRVLWSVEVKQNRAEPHEQSYFLPGWKKEVPGSSWEGQVS